MTLQEALNTIRDNGDMEFSVRKYSGRGMYGKECLAIDGDDIEPILLGYLIGLLAADDLSDLTGYLKGMRSDSMGRGMVYYWPYVKFAGEEESYDDDNED
jgi:hypothetical protein